MKHKEIETELKVFKRGIVDLISEEELKQKLIAAQNKKRPLRIKYGVDPSFPDIHLGHTVPLRKLKALQQLGHEIIFLIGDFTAQIGDPSERIETRKMMSREAVGENARTYQKQVFKVLDREKTIVRYNSEWLDKLKPEDFLNLTAKYTVARILERDDFKKRYEQDKPITILEFLYPLLQGYDSVMLRADVEIGGTDQKFNLLVGRELQRDYGQEPQVIMTLPLLEGTDGSLKMSKSFGNYIGIDESAREMFGKIMSIPDNLMIRYFSYLTDLSDEEINHLQLGLKEGREHPRQLKARLAKEIVTLYHSEEGAQQASKEFDRVFKEGKLPDKPRVLELETDERKGSCEETLVGLLQRGELVSSKNEARRLIEQGAVEVDGKKIMDINSKLVIKKGKELVIKCGKRKFVVLRGKPR